MKRLVAFALALAVSFSTALAQEKDHEKKMQELEQQINDLMLEIEVIKATSGSGEQKEEKFKMFGYFGMRYQDMNFESKKVLSDAITSYESTSASKLFDPPAFVHNNLNIYFQFNPVENFRVLSEIRFLYYPAGLTSSTGVDRSTMVPFASNKFWALNPATGTSTWYESNFAPLPINKDGIIAVRATMSTFPIPVSATVSIPVGTWLPIDSQGNYILASGGKYILISPTGTNLGYTSSSSIVFTDTPLMASARLYENKVDNYFLDQTTGFWGQYGSINVERAFMEWTPDNAYGFRAGKFFTPFGVWNVDHGTPVLLTARVPYFLTYLPETQMGVEAFGRFNFPHTDLDYSVYVSNGRGALKEMEDNNDNKSVGGRLALKLQMPLFKELSIGTSGYYGKHDENTTEIAMNYSFNVDSTGVTPNNITGSEASMTPEIKTIVQADEIVFGLDFKATFQDLIFQSEFMYRQLDVNKFDQDHVNKWGSIYYQPTVESVEKITAYYLQMAYKLPWELKGLAFTPFARWEYVDGFIKSKGYLYTAEDSGYNNKMDNISMGLNIRQNPFVVYKLDYTFTKFENRERLNFNIVTVCADIAF